MSAVRADGQRLLDVSDVTLRFGRVTALQDVTFDVNDNELFAIIGPNGAGKTSIFNCLNGVYHPQEGTIRFDGTDVIGMRPSATAHIGIARTFQNLGLFVNLNVIDNLMLGRHHLMKTGSFRCALVGARQARGGPEPRARRGDHRAHRARPYRYMPVGMLPYGSKKRVELGRALAMEPKLLLLDEPVAGMNLEETEDMARYILQVRAELGVSIILVEHDMHLVMDIADRVLALDFGRPIAFGRPEEVQKDARVIEAYLGQPA
jgi:branched-chain amino acid transport system ATP-binding protein